MSKKIKLQLTKLKNQFTKFRIKYNIYIYIKFIDLFITAFF